MFIGQEYTRKVILRKVSDGDASATIRLEGKTCEGFECRVVCDPCGVHCDGSEECAMSIEGTETLEMDVVVSSHEIGEKEAYFLINPTDGIPMSFSIKANFIGPQVSIVEPSIDFGLLKIYSSHKFWLNIENHSPIHAPVLIKHSSNTDLTFETLENYQE